MQRILSLGLLALFLLTACGAPTARTLADAPDGLPAVTVYKSPT